ncbi:hypothetical protein [Terricaulis sp.]|uniref:hypothetical protein n=1 Tax=Terricaulis sp. TaxID=2768686 RepID=UPI003782F714
MVSLHAIRRQRSENAEAAFFSNLNQGAMEPVPFCLEAAPASSQPAAVSSHWVRIA